MQDQTHKKVKFVYNEKRALLEQGCHLNTCNHKSDHFIRFPGGLSPWYISAKTFSLANFTGLFQKC